eukprot:scaffold4480_cov57-Phaeocystis_antarctica.AAC.3
MPWKLMSAHKDPQTTSIAARASARTCEGGKTRTEAYFGNRPEKDMQLIISYLPESITHSY